MNLFKFLLVITLAASCKSINGGSNAYGSYPDIKVIGAMKNVMWKGKLEGSIALDTISDKNGLYGIGPEQFLRGEILLKDGINYISRVTSDSTMQVQRTSKASAPFFVYANVEEWNEIDLPKEVKSITDLEKFIDKESREYKRPFAFKLNGRLTSAQIHIQNLPPGSKVSSPEEAHKGQVNYELDNEMAEIIGFFSTEHKGIFTHHDSFLHMHLITHDESKMGHLDRLEIDKMTLLLPKS